MADYVVFVLSDTCEVDEWGDLALRCLQAQGLPEVVTVVAPSRSLSEPELQNRQQQDSRARSAVLKSLLSFIRYFVPSQSRVYDLGTAGSSDATSALRALCEGKPSDVHWRQGRSWMLGENVEWEAVEGGTLKVTGVIRGMPLSTNRLIHVPNHGDFQLSTVRVYSSQPLLFITYPSQILSAPSGVFRKGGAAPMDLEPAVLAVPSSDADSLVSVNDPDTTTNEQTWPTDEEMCGADAEQLSDEGHSLPDASIGTTPKAVKKVPKGTSQYQAAWIVEDEEENDADVDGSGDEEGMQEIEMDEFSMHAEDDMELESDRRSAVAFKDLDVEEEDKQCVCTFITRTVP